MGWYKRIFVDFGNPKRQFRTAGIFIGMHTQFETLLLDGDSKAALKTAIKKVIREMIAEAIEGRLQLPNGMEPAEQILKLRLTSLDALLNPSGSL